jgi:hypothetical protein
VGGIGLGFGGASITPQLFSASFYIELVMTNYSKFPVSTSSPNYPLFNKKKEIWKG